MSVKFSKTIIAGLFLTASVAVNAELVTTDWKNTGDELATLDTDTGIEWLDLTQTDGMSINQVESLTGEGSTFEGWRLPTQPEIVGLMSQAFPSEVALIQLGSTYRSTTSTETINEARAFKGLFGYVGSSGGFVFSAGLVKNITGTGYAVTRAGTFYNTTTTNLMMKQNVDSSYGYTNPLLGVFLVKDDPVAPEPEENSSKGATLNSDFTPSGEVSDGNKIRFVY